MNRADLTTRLPAIIPSSIIPVKTPANVVRLFAEKADAAPAERPNTVWRGNFDLKNAFVARRRLDRGTKQFGDPELYRLLAWENPSRPGQFTVGMMWEIYPYGQQIKGLPKTIRLHLHSNHASFEAAEAVCKAMSVNNVFGDITKLIEQGKGASEESKDLYPVLSTNPEDVPFLRLDAWKGVFLFNAARLSNV